MRIAPHSTILRFHDGLTDKVWVIVPNVNASGDHLVSWGATRWQGTSTPSLQSKRVSGSENSRIQKKLDSGYTVWDGVQFDLDDHRVVQVDEQPAPKPNHNPSFWYRIDPALFEVEVGIRLYEISDGLHQFEYQHGYPGLVAEFQSLSLVSSLRKGDTHGQVEYASSPMAAMLLFALRRAHPSLILVSDDNNDLLPDRLNDLRSLMSDEALFGPLPEYWQLPVFKAFAAAMQCIDSALDLSQIKSDTQAAFF